VLANALAVGVLLTLGALVVGFALGLTVKVFFDGLDALDPLTRQLGPGTTLFLYALGWVAVIG
jgi:hypothetical protein